MWWGKVPLFSPASDACLLPFQPLPERCPKGGKIDKMKLFRTFFQEKCKYSE